MGWASFTLTLTGVIVDKILHYRVKAKYLILIETGLEIKLEAIKPSK